MSNFTVYRSSAGSGKTHTLVKEYIRLAISGNDYAKRFARILAITFTNKASAEMKERVIKNLYTLKLDPSHAEYNQKYLDEIAAFCSMNPDEVRKRAALVFTTMLHNYHLLKITTIDKFTVQLVYSFARDLQLDADHEIVTDVNEVIDAGVQLLLEQSGRDQVLTNMFVDFLGFEMEEGERFNAKRELRKFCEKVLDEKGYEALELSSQHSEQEFIDAGKLAASKINEIDKKIAAIIDDIFVKLKSAELGAEDFYFRGSGNYTWLKNVKKEGFYAIKEGSRLSEFIEGKPGKRWHKEIDAKKEAIAEQLGHEIAKGIVQLFEVRKKEARNYIVHSTVRKNAFSMALFKRLHNTITEYKTANSIILLSEFTQKVSDIVASEPAPFIYERLGERVKNIFVDEFQDTSGLQFSNLVPLMDESLAKNEFVMLVGDAKQSIYRWRNGNVEQFIDLPALPPKTLENTPERQYIFKGQYVPKNLDTNYRSRQNVVEFNNAFFEKLAAHAGFGSEKLKLAYADVKQKHLETKPGGYVEMELVPKAKKNNATESDEEELEGAVNFTLKRIEMCIANGYTYSDIAILVRVHYDGEKIFTALRKKGIPVVSNQALGLANSPEIKSITSLYAGLHSKNPGMLLKQFAFDYAGFLKKHNAYEKAIASLNFKSKPVDALGLFGISFNKITFDSLNLFEQIHYLANCLKMPAGNSFLASFYELVFDFFRKNGSNAGAFIEWWSQNLGAFKLQTGQGTDRVKIITIHKSKGLQYPVVIMPFIKTDVRNSESFFWLKNVPGYDIKPLPVQYGLSLGDTEWNEDYETEKKRSAFDVLNVLYVAFTRAEEQFFGYFEYSPAKIEENPVTATLKQLGWQEQQVSYTKGSPVVHVPNRRKVSEKVEIPLQIQTEFTSWYNKIEVSTHLVSEKHRANKLREKGIAMHELASVIQHKGQVDSRIEKFMNAGKIAIDEVDAMKQAMHGFFASRQFETMRERSLSQLSEIEITDGKGHISRPDRVFIFKDKTAAVIDVKTGEEDEEHHEQVRQYAVLVQQCGYTVNEKWLYYFKSGQWITVA
ncbi:MAG TPA: UvrD-helicase domain-containing protein [Flavobacteriales bacterium]|nr:UvrD-helicase domain-containing protein [Flavobacteriales bacterium]